MYLCHRMKLDWDNKSVQWMIFVLLSFTWGSSFILMKRGLEAYSPQQVAALRMFISFVFLSPIAIKNLKRINSINWKYFLGVGLLGNTIPAFLFTTAQTGISSSLTGILNALTPLFTLIIGLLIFKTQIKRANVYGILLGLIGAMLLIFLGKGMGENSNYTFGLLVVLATFLYGISVNIIRHNLSEEPSLAITSLAFLLVGPFVGAYLFSTDFTTVLQTHPKAWSSLGYITILSIFGTSLAVIIYNILIKKTGALFASSVTYFIPVVAVMWGMLDGESFNLQQAGCVGIILGGVWLVNKK